MNISLLFNIAIIIFLIGLWGLFFRKNNLIIMIMSIEIIFLSVNYLFMIFSKYLDDVIGLVFVIALLTLAGAESSIILAILVLYFRLRGTISVLFLNLLKS